MFVLMDSVDAFYVATGVYPVDSRYIFIIILLPLLAPCPPGNFSSDGFSPCQTCQLGTYQPHSGRVVCYPCPGGGKFGGKAGAVSVSECPSMYSTFFK